MKKLVLTKDTMRKLNEDEMDAMRGGAANTCWCYPSPNYTLKSCGNIDPTV